MLSGRRVLVLSDGGAARRELACSSVHDACRANASSSGASAVPLLFNFHGFGGEASDQMSWADFRPLADEHGFILVYPQGTELEGYTHWNSALPSGDNKSTADDFGFVIALIDQISTSHNIDAERVYASGYSNGGFMAMALACHHGERFAAVVVPSDILNQNRVEAISGFSVCSLREWPISNASTELSIPAVSELKFKRCSPADAHFLRGRICRHFFLHKRIQSYALESLRGGS